MEKQQQENGQEGDGDKDLRARFPDPDNDARLRTPRVDELPPPPRVNFERPRPRKPEQNVRRRGIRLGGSPLTDDMRGAGIASTVGITLAASIAVGTGLGWLFDTFVLKGRTAGATPWGLIVGFLVGTASGFVNLGRVAGRLNKDDS